MKYADNGSLAYSVETTGNGFKGIVSISYTDGGEETFPFTVTGSRMTIYDDGGNAIWELTEQQD